jgi:two-component system, chemotaxis family, sensor kinase CheA
MTAPDPAEIFRQEAQELLETLEQALLDLEHTPGDMALIDSAFRALHTLKGSGAMFGFSALAGFTHHVETAFDRVRKNEVAATPGLIAVVLGARDRMRLLIENPDAADPREGEAILAALRQALDDPQPAVEPASSTDTTWCIRFRLAENAMVMGTNPLLLLDELRGLGSATVTALTDAIPPLEALVPSNCHLGWDVRLTTSKPRAAIDDVFMFVIDDMELHIAPAEAGEPVADVLPEADPDLEPVAADPVVKPVEAAKAQVTKVARTTDSIRVPAERLDDLMDRVGELMIAQSRLSQVAANSNDAQVKSVAEEIERLAIELRDTTMGVRTMPIGSLFGRFRRLVHDLSQQLSKKIQLTTIGEETELDKTMIERLNDPLIHLIRNSVDHGLEAPETRLAAGKPEHGQITLSARHVGAEVLVSIRDDGKGLDRVRIQARGEEQGLLTPGVKLSDSELFQVVFQPGFSTAKEVTSLSGRGVGMDVVKRTIEELRGKIDITSTPGQGTELTLRLPLTLAIIDGLLVRIGNGRYVLPLSAVEECVELSADDDARSQGRSFLNIRGDLVPYLRLRELFRATTPPDSFQKVVIVSAGDNRVGLVVDQVIGNHQTVIKSLSKLQADVRTFSGATILGDGTVALILDIMHLVDLGQAHEDRLKAIG